MSKVICDVCGTTYPETAAQCPICGSAKATANQTAAGGESVAATGGYTGVKGGRFSKQNVKKRNKKASATTAQRRSSASRAPVQKEEPNNTGLVIVVVLLLLAIVSVLIYIFTTYWNNKKTVDPTDTNANTQQTTTAPQDTDPEPERIACTGLLPSNTVIEFTEAGQSWQLQVELTPVDTTDSVTYRSTDPSVATVTDDGLVTAVDGGEAVIIIECGEQSASCVINCNFGQPKPDDPDYGVFEFEFNTPYVDAVTGYGDCTLSAYGATWKAYKSSLTIPVSDITWVSDDPSIATIEKGVVKAMAPGVTRVHATYNGVTYTCVIRCAFSAESVGGECIMSHTDVTLSVGQSFTLRLKDSTGTVNVTWTADGEGVSIDGNKITAVAKGTYKVSCSHDGVTYTCTVRVKE